MKYRVLQNLKACAEILQIRSGIFYLIFEMFIYVVINVLLVFNIIHHINGN